VSTTLVTGPVRSGKSRHAEHLLATHPDVLYVACGRLADDSDPEWRQRLREHQSRRPESWHTLETLDLVEAIDTAAGPVLVDCLGTWLTGLVDRVGWDDLVHATAHVRRVGVDLVHALSARSATRPPIVLVTNEVGWSLVPTTPVGRFFADELGRLNAAVSEVADRVHLVVAGRVIDLTSAPVVSRQPPARGLHA
jgi:adenosylcobinamide kinase/adenosylcobinamide-phosphate guanylyltransferase